MTSYTTNILFITLFLVLIPAQTLAFGAGDIPDFAYLNDKAFRHGDIENVLVNLAKAAGSVATGGGLLGLAHSMLSSASGGAKFDKGDIKKVYFGNWLRDYSQAMDISGLSKLSADTLVLVVSVLGFMTFGFATDEFQVTPDRLGVYLPVEHIDNPKGYSEKEGDARNYHPKLRPPVDPRELEIDQRTGMKNYIATENQSWDTSTACIRRTLKNCIHYGRRARGSEGPDLWEAYRLMGTGLHTLEDLLAHSNWCELTLRKMGHKNVFCHVGDAVLINTPNGRAPPLVTGTFGGADFLHSLMGEATDHISQASVTDLSKKINNVSQDQTNQLETLKNLFSKLPISGSSESINQGEDFQQQSKAYNFDPDNVAPPEVQQQLFSLLSWHDNIYRNILTKIEAIPGLTDLVENITNALNAYVYSILAPWLSPILQQATSVLGEGSKAVIDSDDQYEVFNNPHASDPSHSLLSKDHFGLILNEPAGKIAQLVVENTVKLIVEAWFDDGKNLDQVINQILEAFHHPYYATGRSRIQQQMYEGMEKWLGGLGSTESEKVLQALTKESVRNGKNKRQAEEDESAPTQGSYGSSQSGGGYDKKQGQGQYGAYSGGYGNSGREEQDSYSRRNDRDDNASYNNQPTTYGTSQGYTGRQERDSYSARNNRGDNTRYDDQDGSSQRYSSGRNRNEGEGTYGPQREEDYIPKTSYGARNSESESYGERKDNTRHQSSHDHSSEGYGAQTGGHSRRNDLNTRNESSREDYSSLDYGKDNFYTRSEQTPQEHRGYSREETYDSSGYNRKNPSSYVRTEECSEGGYAKAAAYSSGYDRNTERNEESSYEQPRQERSYGQSSDYGSGRSEHNRSVYGGREETELYGDEKRGYRGRDGSQGYEEGYSRGRDENEEGGDTFGVGRLNLGNEY